MSLAHELLEKRFQELQKVDNENSTAQLKFIDQFLHTKQGQRAVRKAIEIVKPYFL